MKKFGTILLSVLLVLCMAMGATACDNDSGNGGGGNEPPNPPAATPALELNVESITLVKGQSVKVTATVTNTDKKATFKLTGENASEVAKVETAEDNAATVTALGDGEATLVIELEGATSVSVPVTVNGMLNLTGIITELTGEYDLNASDDSNKSGTFGVEHYLGDDYKVEVLYENSSVA